MKILSMYYLQRAFIDVTHYNNIFIFYVCEKHVINLNYNFHCCPMINNLTILVTFVGNRSIILKFSYAHQDASMESTSNEGRECIYIPL